VIAVAAKEASFADLQGGAVMSLAVKNLKAPLGAEISGLDLSKPITAHEVKTIEEAWRERLVVVFHDQKLSDPRLIAFSKNFGELDPPGPNPYGEPFLKEHPELNVISNVLENGKPIGNLGDGEAAWRADMTYVEVPPGASCTAARSRVMNGSIEPRGDSVWALAVLLRWRGPISLQPCPAGYAPMSCC
jgi:taurine dioxygenase